MAGSGLYRQDVIAPVSVCHLVEYGDPQEGSPGEFGHWYNYIDYVFEDGDGSVRARHYFDEPGTALLISGPSEAPFVLKVMVFLLMRYPTLQWLVEGRYAPVDEGTMARVRAMLAAHLAANAD